MELKIKFCIRTSREWSEFSIVRNDMPANLMWCRSSGESEWGKFGEQPPMPSSGLGTPHRIRTAVDMGRSLTCVYLCDYHIGSESSSLFFSEEDCNVLCTISWTCLKSRTSEAMISFMAYGRHITLNSIGLYLPQIFTQVEINEHEYIHMSFQINTP